MGNAAASDVWRTECLKCQRSHLCFLTSISVTSPTPCPLSGYADDLALLFSHKCWNEVEDVLSLDMQRIAAYLSAWKLRLSTAKTTCTVFHLNNRNPAVNLRSPSMVGLPPSPTGRIQFTSESRLTANSPSGNTWKASVAKPEPVIASTPPGWPSILRTSALRLVYNAAEYASPVWCRNTHTKQVDVLLNDTLRIISGCLKQNRRELLPVLSGIQPAQQRREHSTFKLDLQAQLNTNHPLHALVRSAQFPGTQRLHSRHPFRRHAAALINSGFNILESWRVAWENARHWPSFWSPLPLSPVWLRASPQSVGSSE